MTTLEIQNKNKSAVSSRLLVLMIAILFLNFSFKIESKAHGIECRNDGRGDTLSAVWTAKAIAANIKRDSSNRVVAINRGLFLPVDPDDATPSQRTIDTRGSYRARMAMKLYLYILIIGPKANDQLKKAKNKYNREANDPNPGKNFSSEAFRQVILLSTP